MTREDIGQYGFTYKLIDPTGERITEYRWDITRIADALAEIRAALQQMPVSMSLELSGVAGAAAVAREYAKYKK